MSDKTLQRWELSNGQCIQTVNTERGVGPICVSADGRYLLWSHYFDKKTHFVDTVTGRNIQTFEAVGLGGSLCLTPDCRYVLTSDSLNEGRTSNLKLWEVSTGRCLCTTTVESQIRSLCVSADGLYAVSSSLRVDHVTGFSIPQAEIQVWELPTLRRLQTLDIAGTTFSLSLDGLHILSVCENEVKLWELATGQCVWTFQGHSQRVTSAYLTHDGRYVVTASMDKTLKVWFLDWELEEKASADWDESARSYLVTFLTLHTPCAFALPDGVELAENEMTDALSRRGEPIWTEADFRQLLQTLSHAGYGWLRSEGVRRKLETMAAEW